MATKKHCVLSYRWKSKMMSGSKSLTMCTSNHVCASVWQSLTCCCSLLQPAPPRWRSSPAPALICRVPPVAPCWLPRPEGESTTRAHTWTDDYRQTGCRLGCVNPITAEHALSSTRSTSHRRTLRMRMKSCLSTRRKWQLSSLRMMVAARGASFSRASWPKSSPSCKVVTRPCSRCSQAHFHIRLASDAKEKLRFKSDFYLIKCKSLKSHSCVPSHVLWRSQSLSRWCTRKCPCHLDWTLQNRQTREQITPFLRILKVHCVHF